MRNRINWPKIIKDLILIGETEASIASAVDSSQPAIHRYKSGEANEPGHALGERLLALHERLVSPEPAAAEATAQAVVVAGSALGYDAMNNEVKAD